MDHSKLSPQRRPRWLYILLGLLLLIIIIVIVVPLAVILPRKHHHHGTKSTILLPLYIYPETSTTWSPLYDALNANPDLNFTVIINPSSGPGSSSLPNEQYITEVKKLNGFSNVRTVGYVRTGYGSRNLSDVISEVGVYAGWASNSSLLAMSGIFFDEAPHVYSAGNVTFMKNANDAVKSTSGLTGDRTIIHNPGVIPDARYNLTNTDITVVFEESYANYLTGVKSLEALPTTRSNYSIMIHSVPDLSSSKMKDFVDDVSPLAQYLFITNNTANYYESFAGDWAEFASVVPT